MDEDGTFADLLERLADAAAGGAAPDAADADGRRAVRVGGGANGLVYRVVRADGIRTVDAAAAFAVKLTARDGRDRAGREHGALVAIAEAGLDLAPRPVLLERERYALPVVVQTWVDGPVVSVPPELDEDWHRLVEHYVAMHDVIPARVATRLPPAVLTMDSAAAGRQRLEEQLTRLPLAHRPAPLRQLVERLDGGEVMRYAWDPPRAALCRCDANTSNFVRRSGLRVGWASVDWENSGWGDPAFEIAELTAHPAYFDVPADRWPRVVEAYCSASARGAGAADVTLGTRIRAYAAIMLVWWVARLARYLYEIPRGLDRRLGGHRPDWQEECSRKLSAYAERASAALA